MKIFSVLVGFGMNSEIQWFAANTENQALELCTASGKVNKIRKIRCFRDVDKRDDITEACRIMFSGFGIEGPAREFPTGQHGT